ncbi:MAG: ABC transporter substrate-binding protein [Nitrososphaerota archaeon]|nr:ABC transporter substrate-binding protein [Candidatus Bathyarchaeota archaeon]MDW8022529.1 ABC transporter substrate-binding protein [Nitrososphaerota archaeon]
MPVKKKIIILALVVVAVIAGILGAVVWQRSHMPPRGATGPISVIDDAGRNVTIINYPPKRIVSLAPSCTEILFALDLGDKVVGVDTYSDYPPDVKARVEAGQLTTVGSFAEISVELVIGLRPDLILATGGVQRAVVESLAERGQTVIVLYPKKFENVLENILLVGKATGQMSKAESLVADMRKKAQAIADKTKNASRPRVYVECFFDGGYWSFGAESYISELISMAGGINVFAGFPGNYMAVSTEVVAKANPEIIIISKGAMAMACGLTPETIKARPGWDVISAVKNNRIYEVEESIMVRGGPRLVKALEEIAKIIHPELFS